MSNYSSPRKEMQNSVMKVIKSFPNFNSFAFLRALPKAVNTAEIKSNAVNNAKPRYECEENAGRIQAPVELGLPIAKRRTRKKLSEM